MSTALEDVIRIAEAYYGMGTLKPVCGAYIERNGDDVVGGCLLTAGFMGSGHVIINGYDDINIETVLKTWASTYGLSYPEIDGLIVGFDDGEAGPGDCGWKLPTSAADFRRARDLGIAARNRLSPKKVRN
jgi:hypothetical protein